MRLRVDSFFDELTKLGAISDDQARRSLDRLDQLDKNKPTPGQVARYGALGAGAGALGHVVSRAIEGGERAVTRRSILGSAASGAIGMGAVPLVRGALDRHAEKKTLKAYLRQPEKTAAGAPTRGGFMMASDIPPFRSPQLGAAIQKTSGFDDYSQDTTKSPPPGTLQKDNQESEKEKNSDALPNFVTYEPGDFKRSKYASRLVQLLTLPERYRATKAALEKDSDMALAFDPASMHKKATITPQSQLEKSTSVGAPKVSAPPGPSIADIAKPRGKAFGIGMPGAFKNTIG